MAQSQTTVHCLATVMEDNYERILHTVLDEIYIHLPEGVNTNIVTLFKEVVTTCNLEDEQVVYIFWRDSERDLQDLTTETHLKDAFLEAINTTGKLHLCVIIAYDCGEQYIPADYGEDIER